MSGNPDNAAVWGGADVLVGSTTAVIPTAGNDYALYRTQSVTTTSGSANVTAASGTVTAKDVGLSISGTGIPALSTILSITNATTFVISANATASATVTGTIGAVNGWKYVGLLDGGQGFEESVEQDSTDHSAWGYGVIATTYGNKKTQKTFTALEENSTVFSLTHDVTSMTFDDTAGTYQGDLGVRDDTTRVRLAFITTSGTTTRRLTTKNYATLSATGAGSESEESPASKSFTATIFPDENSVLWTVYKGV